MPDIFMPADTTYTTKLFTDLIRKNVINSFCIDYVLKNREQINESYPEFGIYNEKFIIDDAMIEEVKKIAEALHVQEHELLTEAPQSSGWVLTVKIAHSLSEELKSR